MAIVLGRLTSLVSVGDKRLWWGGHKHDNKSRYGNCKQGVYDCVRR